MASLFSLTVMAPEQTLFQGRARSLVAPGVDGYFGVLAHHAAMVAQLGIGGLSLVDETGATRLLAVTGGFLETGDNRVTILADAAEVVGEIDVARAEAAERRARERLRQRSEDIDVVRAQAALQRALNRLRIAGEGRG